MTSPFGEPSANIVGELDLLSKIERGGEERRIFEEYYELRTRVLEAHVHTALAIFEDDAIGLSARFIQHIPISTRIKEIKSAIGSLRRRQNERERRMMLKERFEYLPTGGNWEKYWSRQGKPYLTNDVGVFPDYDSMFEALHDIGGLRVCVYFPEDIKKVIEFIKEHQDIEDNPIIAQWGPGANPDDDLETYLDNIQDKESEEQDPNRSLPSQPEPRPFGGYRATHVRMKVRPSSVDWNKTSFLPSQRPKGDFTIEVQISTAVMHAWAQVEQDLIYKPKHGPASQGLRNVLDIFNGIVAMGETSLKQLALIQAEERERSAEAENALAEDRDILSSWIWKACRETSPTMKDPRTRLSPSTRAWSHLGKLLLILQSSKNHSYGAISRLVRLSIEEKERVGESVTCDFALDILATLAREGSEAEAVVASPARPSPERAGLSGVLPTRSDSHGDHLRKTLRAQVLYVVDVLKMAAFLGVESDFFACARLAMRRQGDENSRQRTPSLLDMLDVLHPEEPTLCDGHFINMMEFCDRFRNMALDSVATTPQQLLRASLPKLMVDNGYSAQPVVFHKKTFIPGIREYSVVPRELCNLLDDPENTHWVPEILVLANRMAETRNNIKRRLTRQVIKPYRSADRGGYSSERISLAELSNQDMIYDLLRDLNRLSFESQGDSRDSTKLTIDRQGVPLTWTQTKGVPTLHVDKKAQGLWPHPGYFVAMGSSTSSEPGRGDDVTTNAWFYNQGRAARWVIRWQEAPIIDTKDVGNKPSEGGDRVVLGLAKRLNTVYGSVEQIDDNYIITNQGVQFMLFSTPDEYILREVPEGSMTSEGTAVQHAGTDVIP